MPEYYPYGRVVAERADEPLMGLQSQQLGMSLMGAMTAAVLRRARDGIVLDDHDFRVIEDASKMLRASADAIAFISCKGKAEYPRVHSFVAAGRAAETVFTARSDSTETQSDHSSAEHLRKLADQLDVLRDTADRDAVIESILPSFSALADQEMSSSKPIEGIDIAWTR